ncbi:glucose-1-phosphate thymidylyltransferase [Sulfoacidibacillus thermotolerans]|uniref:Glucose-1-phosphate thymidylyltransferase n=1 Tax=Sulfoacidibacillus thermotolerans TaxID=1765684 RepID=A0A2U3D852_SULT2|nr:glucose-1-phosphate thymidylyltransferase [Sulfoacidibacillus thermotolerans]PWI57458.1 glucose-1-phosphate thymidylyltransferase [Sulfoacidibacillus thermotolerans]
MKGLILSGGTGTRLRPLTFTQAKQLLPIANQPILFLSINTMRDAGIHEIGIILGNTAAEVRAAVGNGEKFGVAITYIEQSEPLGLAHAVKTAAPFLGDQSFLMMLGDNVIHGGITHAVEQFIRQSSDALVLAGPVANPEQFGVIKVSDERVVQLVEKPQTFVSHLALCGVYLFQPIIHEAIRAITPSLRGELEITDAIQWLVDNGYSVTHCLTTSWWKDTGRPSDLLDANRLLLQDITHAIEGSIDAQSEIIGPVRIAQGAVIKNSTLRGPIAIGKNAHIEDSYIGPYTSIGDEVQIRKTEVEYSVILEHSVIDQAPRLDQCILGRSVRIGRTSRKPRTMRMVLGDSSIYEW